VRVPTVTEIVPVVAVAGIVVVILVAVLAVTIAATSLNFTMLLAGVVLKFVPVIVTVAPPTSFVGVKLVIVGAGGADSTEQEFNKAMLMPMNTR